VALAEQLGRLVGTAQARTDGWLDRQALNDQLTRIRDGASGLIGQLAGEMPQAASRRTAKATTTPAAPTPTANVRGRSGGNVGAPGKAHRKAPAPARGVKHSDQAIPKARAARQTRRAPRG
jgi:hypothetical protein